MEDKRNSAAGAREAVNNWSNSAGGTRQAVSNIAREAREALTTGTTVGSIAEADEAVNNRSNSIEVATGIVNCGRDKARGDNKSSSAAETREKQCWLVQGWPSTGSAVLDGSWYVTVTNRSCSAAEEAVNSAEGASTVIKLVEKCWKG